MNGLSLLLALATLGIDVEWEKTPSGDIYTIRAEPLVIDRLRNGAAIESVVNKADLGFTKFRVAVGPRTSQSERIPGMVANEVDYGWRPNEIGGMDYFVQISLERLETLSRGIPLDCEIHSAVRNVNRIFVIVGDQQLPREQSLGGSNSTTAPRSINTINDSRGGTVAPVSGTDSNRGAPRYGDRGYGTQVNVSDTNRTTEAGSTTRQGNTTGVPAYGSYGETGSTAAGGYGRYGDRTLPVPPLDSNRTQEYDYGRDPYPRQQERVALQPTSQPAQNYGPAPTYTAQLPQPPAYATPAAQPPAAYAPPAPTAAPLTVESLAAALALQRTELDKGKESAATEVKEQSSKPLILTTLALFASIAANGYLGWLAWSFFWRFRDAASDLSRARSNAFPAGSLAGH